MGISEGVRASIDRLVDASRRRIGQRCVDMGLREGDLIRAEWREDYSGTRWLGRVGIYLGIDGNGHAWMLGDGGPTVVDHERFRLLQAMCPCANTVQAMCRPEGDA